MTLLSVQSSLFWTGAVSHGRRDWVCRSRSGMGAGRSVWLAGKATELEVYQRVTHSARPARKVGTKFPISHQRTGENLEV